MSWYSTGSAEAEKLAASTGNRRRPRNFFTKPGERAVIRFLVPATESFNYKRAFVPWAKGQKLLTSPDSVPDPFVERGLSLQAASAWPIIDRRKVEFTTDEGEDKSFDRIVRFFADGMRTRKQLVAFERDMLDSVNEEREEDGKEPFTLEEFNLSHYDITVSKEKGAPWNFTAKRAKKLSKEDLELLEKAQLDIEKADWNKEWLAGELAPLPEAELVAILGQGGNEPQKVEGENAPSYSYDDDDDDTVSFDD